MSNFAKFPKPEFPKMWSVMSAQGVRGDMTKVVNICIYRVANRPGMAGTVPELTSGVPCPGLGHFCPGIY